MTELTGTWPLVLFILRRDRVRIAVWILSITALVAATASSIKALFPTRASLDHAAAASQNAAVIAFNGPPQGLDTVGGEVAFQAGTFGLILVGLMSLLMIGRCTRADEESGRAELLRATALGRNAPIVAALVVVAGMNLVTGIVVTVSLILEGLPSVGSVSFGASFVAMGLVFSALALVTAQISASGRAASGLAGAFLGYAFVMRAIGDIRGGRLSWLSPIGWSQKVRPFAGELWWPFAVPIVATVVLLLVASALIARRDFGAGLVQPRPGPPVGSPFLGHPLGLAVRQQRATLFWWSFGLLVGGFVYGSVANDVKNFINGNKALQELMAAAGGPTLIDAYFGTAMLVLALIGTGFVVQSMHWLHGEESGLHTEYVLATPTSRYRWVISHLLLAMAGSAIVLAAAGLGAGLPYAVETQDAHQIPRLLGASLLYLPASWLFAGLAAALYGLTPRAITITWAALAACFVIGFLGDVLKPPQWLTDLSPFERTPHLPAASFQLEPLIVLLAIALVLMAVGAEAFRRRDLG